VLARDRYHVIDLPVLTAETLEAFEGLPLDPFTGGRQRYRRFSQYRMDWAQDAWGTTLLPHRPFVQPASVNSLVGGVQRPFEPLRIDPSPQLQSGAGKLGLDPVHPWQVNVHQCRVVTNDEITGISVPEGPHRDGHDFGMLAVWARERITGGINELIPTGGGVPFFTVTLQPGQALIYDDNAMWHNATDISAAPGVRGHRDLWIVAFNRWDRRKYGAQFESVATGSR
jgi:hypothetical protein